MGYDRTMLKQPINVSLNEDLVRQARIYTRNLSGTIEDLLGEFVNRERVRRSDEFSTLWRLAQFDVFRNPGRKQEVIPYVVVVQNARFDRGITRLVAPLVLNRAAPVEKHYLAPRFTIEGQEVVLDVFNLATILAARLA